MWNGNKKKNLVISIITKALVMKLHKIVLGLSLLIKFVTVDS